MDDELIPCPRCGLPADVIAPPPYEDFPHAVCVDGHDNALIPAVLAHLRSLDDGPHVDRCGQPDVERLDP